MTTAIAIAPPGAPPATSVAGLPFWSVPLEHLLANLETTRAGLTRLEAERRLRVLGSAALRATSSSSAGHILARQFGSPLVVLLTLAALLSVIVGEATDSIVIIVVVIASGLLGFWQEHRAAGAVQRLLALVRTEATVLRDGVPVSVPLDAVVPGDLVILAAGATLPADCRLLDAQDLFVDESALTGEAFPVAKGSAAAPADAPLRERTSAPS